MWPFKKKLSNRELRLKMFEDNLEVKDRERRLKMFQDNLDEYTRDAAKIRRLIFNENLEVKDPEHAKALKTKVQQLENAAIVAKRYTLELSNGIG